MSTPTTHDLNDANTGDYLRPATAAEAEASTRAASLDGGIGAFGADDVHGPTGDLDASRTYYTTANYPLISTTARSDDMSEHTHTRTIAGAVWRRISGGAAQQTGAVQIRNIMHDKSAAPPVYERADQAVQIRAKRVSCHTGPKRTRGLEAFVIDWVVWERLPEPDQDGDEWIKHDAHNRLIDAARAAQTIGTAAPVTLSALLAAASISTIARVCGVTPRTVGNWRAGGKVPFVAVYLIAQYTQIPIERVRPDGADHQ